MAKCWSVVIALAACGDDGGGTSDASVRDAKPIDAAIDAPMFNCATSPSVGTYKVFLNFDGVTLTDGTVNDATQNITALFQDNRTTTTIQPWKSTASDRVAQIAQIVCYVREALYLYDVEIVTARPASGDYEMIVFGGQPMDFGFTFGSSTALTSLTATDCMNMSRKDLGWVLEYPINNNTTVVASALDSGISAAALIGVHDALNASSDPKNCMCNVGKSDPVNCDVSKMCTFSASSPISAGVCATASGGMENQIMKLTTAFGARQF